MSFSFHPLQPGAYGFVMIDCPWHFDVRSKKGEAKSPQARYRTMSLGQVADLPVADLLCDGGAVWVWMTWPLIAQQSMIVENAWGLKILTGGAWAKRTRAGKLRVGPGYILRSVCEPFVIAARKGHKLRGRSVTNMIETLGGAAIDGVARQHSRKPEEAYEIAERLTPGLRRADVFAIDVRPGWDQFGDQLGKRR